MSTVPVPSTPCNNEFDVVVAPFVQDTGLPFARVLSAQAIERAFAEQDGLFALDDVYSAPLVLWAFLAQVLADGKESACSAAVSRIATYLTQMGRQAPCGDTGDYCRARAKLSVAALRRLTCELSQSVEDKVKPDWLCHGLHAKLVDGFTFTMPDTVANQKMFPQNPAQTPGVGLPIARACAIFSLATGCLWNLAYGPYCGKETGESALLRTMLDEFGPGDVAVFDRFLGSYLMLALLQGRGAEVCTRLHQRRAVDFSRGRRLGDRDHLVTWTRPQRPDWMDPQTYARIPETMTLREVQIEVANENSRVGTLTIVTTLLDPEKYSKSTIAELYKDRWNVETDICVVKHPLSLDHLRCQSPHMVEREVWVTLLGYNLIRRVMAAAAEKQDKKPRQLSFTGACQVVLASWILWSTGAVRDPARMREMMLEQIACRVVADRPGRVEPRVIKRRRQRYPLMQRPRAQLREELRNRQMYANIRT